MILTILTGAYLFGKNKLKDIDEFLTYFFIMASFECIFYFVMIQVFFPEKLVWLTSHL